MDTESVPPFEADAIGAAAMAAAEPAPAPSTLPAASGGDPPRKPRSAYMLFAAAVREEMKTTVAAGSEGGKVSVAGIAKATGERWKALDEAGKAQYVAAAEAEKGVYAAWKAQGGELPAAHTTPVKATGAVLPAGRVKRLVKVDPAIGTVSADAVALLATSAELCMEALVLHAATVARGGKRKTIGESDVLQAMTRDDMWACLRHDFTQPAAVPHVVTKPKPSGGETGVEGEAGAPEARLKEMFQRAIDAGAAVMDTFPVAVVKTVEAGQGASDVPAPPAVRSTTTAGKKAAAKASTAASAGMMSRFVQRLTAEEARQRADAAMTALGATVAGKRRERDGEEDEYGADDGGETINLEAIRAGIMGKAAKSKPAKRRVRPVSSKPKKKARVLRTDDDDEQQSEEEDVVEDVEDDEGDLVLTQGR